MFEHVAPRLKKTYAGTVKGGYVEIIYQLVGSKEMRHKYKSGKEKFLEEQQKHKAT